MDKITEVFSDGGLLDFVVAENHKSYHEITHPWFAANYDQGPRKMTLADFLTKLEMAGVIEVP